MATPQPGDRISARRQVEPGRPCASAKRRTAAKEGLMLRLFWNLCSVACQLMDVLGVPLLLSSAGRYCAGRTKSTAL